MRILGADLSPDLPARTDTAGTIVLLDPEGRRVQAVRRPASLPAVAVDVGELAGGEPFLLAVNLPVVVPARSARNRPFEGIARRKLGVRLSPGGRAALASGRGGVAGEALMAALAAGGHPCLPFPDRDRRTSGLAEIHPALVVKVLLWEGSAAAGASHADRGERFRGYAPPEYRGSGRRARAERAAALDLIARALERTGSVDVGPAIEALAAAASEDDVERAASLFDASLLAEAARRYLEAPETCVFLGDRDSGYTILPADGLVRRLALGEAPATRVRLFPKASLKERLGPFADLRAVDLLDMPGRPQRVEAAFRSHPLYEFDNLDEMVWWKHCRHVSGPVLPVEGLHEMAVVLGREATEAERAPSLRLVRSRHRTLSFRFDPPAVWRARVPTRDGKTYPFRVMRATYDTQAGRE